MNDRELLELAAKAAGILISSSNLDTPIDSIITTTGDWWNPLTDDGDALRLAVKLQLWLRCRTDENRISASWYDAYGCFAGKAISGIDAPCNGDEQLAATRRTIVSAAAAIGEAMP